MVASAQNIVCPSCHAEIAITEAVAQQLQEDLRREYAQKEKAAAESMAARERLMAQREEKVQREREALEEQVRRQLEEGRSKLLQQARAEASEQVAIELRDMRHQLAERAQQLKSAQDQELTLRKQQRQLEERARTMELEVQRRLDDERARVREELKAQAIEEQRLRLAEKEKVISDLQKQIDVLKQKAEQGSMQLQGEVLELDLEQQLKAFFPFDRFEPVAKGQRGGDVLQIVRTNSGQECGSILWEAKRTKDWSRAWPAKLKEDQRSARAEVAVIVSRVLPAEVRGFGRVEGVWICDFALFLPAAEALRQGLVNAAVARLSEQGRHGKMEVLYDYLGGVEVRQHVEAIVEAFVCLKQDLDAERRAMEKQWAKREKQITHVIRHTAGMYGGIQGIIGQAALPEIKALALDRDKSPAELHLGLDQ